MDDLLSLVMRGVRRLGVRNDTPVPYYDRQGGSLFASPADMPIGDRAYEAYGSVGTLFSIVSQIGNAFASVPWHLYKRTSIRDKKRRQDIPNHPFLTVWDQPNDFMTGRYFREATQQHLDLVGEACIVLNIIGGIVIEMWPVRPDRLQPVRHPTKFLTGWIYLGPSGEEVPLTREQVIQIKLPNPADPYRGMGPVQAILNDIDAARYSAEWNRNFFINGAQPGGIITVDYKMSDKEFKAFLMRWRQQHQGVANAHRVALLENAKWQDTKFSMSDMQFVELRNLPRELIREAFAFPKPMLGTVDDVNRANAEAGKEIMAENQTKPRLERWKDAINAPKGLLSMFANGKTLELDYENPVPINIDQENNQRNSQTSSAKNLVQAGYHPEDAAEACGLPAMRWVGIPSPGQMDVQEDEEAMEQVKEGANARRNKPVLELVGR